ncbi:hypothetical protein EIP86_006029 [Pleurotus ostreatoroseus]|nr:hypothetical protein EIP86_006029 [Pleurotus ostreatoroseus]
MVIYANPTWIGFREAKGLTETVNMGLSLAVLVDIMVAASLVYEIVQTRKTMRGTFGAIC